MRVCLAPFGMFRFRNLGGQAWVYINWALGFQANGCEITLLDTIDHWAEPDHVLAQVHSLLFHLKECGLSAKLALILSDQQQEHLAPIAEELSQLTVPLESVFEETDLFVNFKYGMAGEIVNRFRRSALIDIDPGLLQIWMSEGQLKVAPHDIYFTTGETVGSMSTAIPDCGLTWHYTPPAVHLPAWPLTPAENSAPYTTVTNWWSTYEKSKGEVFNNEKRSTFLDYIDLPSKTDVSFELAIFLAKNETDRRECRQLEDKGWSVQRSQVITGTPADYRHFVQTSRGEFSCAKPSCMLLANAWISDRTLCYLASSKPAVVQYTGESNLLPNAHGLFRFRSMAEAVSAFRVIEADYEQQCRNARELVERHFDASMVAGHVLAAAMVKPLHQA